MELILEDIQRALNAGASYAALAAAVTLPEVCMRCEQENMSQRSGKYAGDRVFDRFVDTYLGNWHLGLTGKDLYAIRNGLSHRGQAIDPKNPDLRYVFFPPTPGISVDNNRGFVDGKLMRLNIDLRKFCDDISDAVRRWLTDNASNPIVQRNLEDVLQSREGSFGTGVYIEGVHFLA